MSKILTLDSGGYVSDPPLVVDIIMNNFFIANYTQTVVHWGRIHSLPYLISSHAEDMFGLASAIERALEIMLSSHFDTVVVNCTIEEIMKDEPLQNIRVEASVLKDGVTMDIGKLLSIVKNRVSGITDI